MSDDATRTPVAPPSGGAAPLPAAPGRGGALVTWKLVLGPDATSWELHEDEDPENVEARLESAGEHGEAVVKVHVPEAAGPVLLHVRPGRSAWWSLVEVLDPTP